MFYGISHAVIEIFQIKNYFTPLSPVTLLILLTLISKHKFAKYTVRVFQE